MDRRSLTASTNWRTASLFQSSPVRNGQALGCLAYGGYGTASFNPRPSAMDRRSALVGHPDTDDPVSILARPQWTGAPIAFNDTTNPRRFSILARPQLTGARRTCSTPPTPMQFQSSPVRNGQAL